MTTFCMLIGLPGSGKSYIANNLSKKQNTIVLSSDKIRGELFGDESVQDNPSLVFETMKKRTIENLKNGINVIYDATNVSRKNRIGLLKQIPKNIDRICQIVWARVETCILRDEQRVRTVGKDVILKILKHFQCPHQNEGWNTVGIVYNDVALYNYSDLNLDIPHHNPHHLNTIGEHIKKVQTEIDRCNYHTEIKNLLGTVAKYHDIGKPICKTFKNSHGEITDIAHYYDHQNVSSYLTLGMNDLQEIPFPLRLQIAYLVNLHMEPFFAESNYWKNYIDTETKALIKIFNEFDRKGA